MTFALIQGNARAASDNAAVTPVSKIVTVFWGIVSYTRWPGEKGPLRVCLPENNRQAMAIRDAARVVKLGRRISVRT
ncbi:MAG: YfiR family protein, partial [Azoarcus sp.]|nr:YfiR family protein [Azoarcus sp.]